MSDTSLKNSKLGTAEDLATKSSTFSIPSPLAKRIHEMQEQKEQRQGPDPSPSGEYLPTDDKE